MTLSTGTKLAHYEITSQIGKGGMGEVYQAKDTKLGRDVAIKVLPQEFAQDTDRVARFQREAKLLASLNHPNIAAIYGLEESEGTHFLVLELIEGDTLADRLKRGAIPVEESLKLALQIAEALEAAHEKGVIHRDLKPANIKVTPDGKVKVLDFGLAKAFAGDQAEVNLSQSPTLSAAATQQGIILGTAAYMSPEQARGKPVDKRTDIWAFGCVLYEMLTGKAAFQGEDVTEILAAVVKSEVNLELLPANIHPRVREAISRCLEKDQKKRYADIGEAQYEIDKVLADPSSIFTLPIPAAKPRKKMRVDLPWFAAGVLVAAIIAGLAVWNLKPPEPRQVTRLYHEIPQDQQFENLDSRSLAVSPDGRQFVYSTTEGLYLRSLGQMDAKPIPGTEGAQNPFFSFDGKWVGYESTTDGQLKKIELTGGAPVKINDAGLYGYYSWGNDDTIVYCQQGKGVLRISSNGGDPEVIVKAENENLVNPQILPDGKSVIFSDVSNEPYKVVAQFLQSGERKELLEGHSGYYLPSGHIVYMVGDSLFAVPFDLDKLEVSGAKIPMVEGVLRRSGPSQYAVSDLGTLIYIPGTYFEIAPNLTLIWVDRKGEETPLSAEPDAYSNFRMSPDGTRVALTVGGSTDADVWIWDFIRKTRTRLTFDKGEDGFPVWSPDSKRIAFHTHQNNTLGSVYWKAANGTGKEEAVGSYPGHEIFPWCWSSDGKTLLVRAGYRGISMDIGALSMEDDREYAPLLKETFAEVQPQLSPDGRWMAYASDESGQPEVYVHSFPELDEGRWQVSANGGESPLWSPDGRELFYRSGDAVMAVRVDTEQAFSLEPAEVLYRGNYYAYWPDTSWGIHPDGKRFLMMKPSPTTENGLDTVEPRRINIVLNWFEELKERVPTD